MSKVTKYLLQRIKILEKELTFSENRIKVLESEVESLESENKNLNWSNEDMESSLFSKERLISDLQSQIKELSPKPTFGDLDVFKELKEKLLKDEQEWKEKQDKDILP